MKLATLLIALLLMISGFARGQELKTDSLSKSEIGKLEFMTGKWEGTGWMMGRDGKKHEFNQTENIQFKIDGVVMLIEGLGMSKGKVTHNAIAIISYNKEEKNYKFTSHLSSGRGGSFNAELKENKFHWYPNENMRYIIWLNEKGQWYETGEFNRSGKWFQFFEMTLDKKE